VIGLPLWCQGIRQLLAPDSMAATISVVMRV
jgi:hypothetical protein